MVLSYTLPNAKEMILAKRKIHSFRVDPLNRWKRGMKIQHALHARSKEYECFAESECKCIQNVIIVFATPTLFLPMQIIIQHPVGVWSMLTTLTEFAYNDGFNDIFDFRKWIYDHYYSEQDRVLTGRLIHWTLKIY